MRSQSWTPVGPAVAPSAVLTLVGVHLRLRSSTTVDLVTRWADRICAELDTTPGLAGYALHLTGDALWVVSAWTTRTSLADFERGPLHVAARRALHPLLQPPVVDVWRAAAVDLPPTWTDVRERLHAAEARTRRRLTGQ